MSALDSNIGESNYSKMEVQPVELAAKMNATPTFLNVAKYISRTKVNWHEDLEKAKHFVKLDEELFCEEHSAYFCREYLRYVRGARVLSVKGLDDFEAQVLISSFTDQFANSSLLFLILYSLYRGEHDNAIGYINELIDTREVNQ